MIPHEFALFYCSGIHGNTCLTCYAMQRGCGIEVQNTLQIMDALNLYNPRGSAVSESFAFVLQGGVTLGRVGVLRHQLLLLM